MIARKNIFRTSEAAYAVDRFGQIMVWNQAAEKTFGYKESEALGQRCWQLLSGRDVFGNQYCCEGCPVRATACNNEPISRFQIDFTTAQHELKRFAVSTLMLFNVPGQEVFVHLCRPESDVNENVITSQVKSLPARKNPHRPLTARETEVLILLHQGKSSSEISARLGICASTVRNHTQHILLKLHAHSQLEAVALGRKFGLI